MNIKKTILAAITLLWIAPAMLLADETKELNVDGVKVFFRHTPKDVISVRLFVLGGTNYTTLEQQGIEALALSVAVNGGTTSRPKTKFNTEAERIGTFFGSSASLDYGEMNMTCVKSFWDKSWELFADAIMNPAFANEDFEIIRSQLVAGAKQREENPDAALQEAAMSFVYKGKSYERLPNGTSSSLGKLTLDATKNYYKNRINKGQCFLVVVGNLTQEEVTARVKATLAKLPAGSSPKKSQTVKISEGKENVVERDIATNYLIGLMSAPTLSSADGIPMMVAFNIIDDHLFLEIRSRRGLSYAPAGQMNADAVTSPYCMIYASTDSPKAVIQVMVDLLNRIKQNGFTQEELDFKKREYLTTTLMNLETSAAQSLMIGKWSVRGDYKIYDDFANRINAVTLSDVNRVVDQNTNAIVWTYLGKPGDVKKEDFRQTSVYKNKPY